MDEHKVDFLDPLVIALFIAAIFSDAAFLGIIGIAIPVIGLAIAGFILLLHYGVGIVILAVFWGKTKGWMAKAILLLAWFLPLPLLGAGIFWAILASNKFIALLVEVVAAQVINGAIQGLAVVTGGAGEILEVGAVAAEGAAIAAEGVEVAATVAEGAEAVGEVGATVAEGAEAVGEVGTETAGTADILASPEEANPMENLQEELEEPQEESENLTKKRVKKVFDIADKFDSQNQGGEEEDEEDYQEAA